MIIHIIFDEQFGDYVVDQFAPYRDRTRLVVVQSRVGEPLQYIKRADEMELIAFNTAEYMSLLDDISKCNAVVMHGLFSYIQYDIIARMPSNVKLAWVLWGTEIYSRPDIYIKNLSRTTRCLYKVKRLKNQLCGQETIHETVPMTILKRVNYCLNSSPNIFEEVKCVIGNPNLKNLAYSYFTLEKLVGQDMLDKRVIGRNILLGNSATLENNHLNAIWRLCRIGIPKGSKVIIPLSYSEPWLKNVISRICNYVFGKQSLPLLDYMPRMEYNHLVQSCSAFICNHYRPNAFGNTLTALWLGARVYASKYSAQTRFLQALGLSVNITEDDLKSVPNVFSPLSDAELEHNRAIIRDKYCEQTMANNIARIMDELDS